MTGLSDHEVAARLIQDGYNELPATRRHGIFGIVSEIVREPMFLLLASCGAIYLIIGEVQDSIMLLGFVFFITGINLYQQQRTEHALEALRDLSSPRACVIRGGVQKRIAGREVVRGDILILSEGDRVPADAAILSSTNLSVDESLLTGESVPVTKSCWDGQSPIGRPGGETIPFVFSGTLVVHGQATAQVLGTGAATEIGRIGKALQPIETEQTPLQKEIRRLVRTVAIAATATCVFLIVVFGLTRGDWLNGGLAGITLAMGILPDELPVVLTIFLALGAWRISKKRVLTRRSPVVETLGAATVLCVDKTGTLTMNRMSVAKFFTDGLFYDAATNKEPLPETFHLLGEFSILASQRDPFDPMEKALNDMGTRYLAKTEHLHGDWSLIRQYPLSQSLLALSHVWKSPDGKDFIIAAKGAPEAIADLCHLSGAETAAMLEKVRTMAAEGLRVLGVARSSFREPTLPGEQHDFEFHFLGLVGFADPIRPEVPAALKECYQAGIRVVMITGDHAATAMTIASQINLTPRDECITGPELDLMNDDELKRRIRTVSIFARVVPEQKLRLVKALKENGEVVAMTGDGVNDAPALKSAHIGIAMGGRGTDVAREAASLVLLDDDFSSIVHSVKLGRRIFDNLKKAMAFILAVHVPIVGLSVLPVLFNWPLILLPVHIAFLHLIIDPACSIVFEVEVEEPDVMSRPPRSPSEPLFGKGILIPSLIQGIFLLTIVLGVFLTALYRGHGPEDARALTFTSLIAGNLGLILTNRARSMGILKTLSLPNPALWWVIGGAFIFMGLVLYQPFLRGLFHFSQLHGIDLAICAAAGLVGLLGFETLKWGGRKAGSSKPPGDRLSIRLFS